MFARRIRDFYHSANQRSGRRLDILKNTLSTFIKTRASQASASLAYYAIFSLFPLLLLLVVGGSYFLNNREVYQNVTQFVQNLLPVSPQLINNNLQQVLDARGTVGLVGLLTLLWSASGFFASLAYNVNLAWTGTSPRNFLEKRLIGMGMIAGLIGLLVISLVLEWITSAIPFLTVGSASLSRLGLWQLLSSLGSWLTIFLLFLALYRWVPTAEVSWSASFWGGLTVSVAWKIATAGFRWYLKSGWGRYQLVYGSLGAIVALLFLIYLLSLIALFGAHLSASIDHWKEEQVSKS